MEVNPITLHHTNTGTVLLLPDNHNIHTLFHGLCSSHSIITGQAMRWPQLRQSWNLVLLSCITTLMLNLMLAGLCTIIQFKQINQPDATVLQVYYLTFCVTCFERLHAHHQELTTSLTASGFTLERVGSSVVSRGLNIATNMLQGKTRGC